MQSNILALDVGSKRIGMAVLANGLNIPRAYGFIEADNSTIKKIQKVINDLKINQLVIGLPRNLDGEDTQQTRYCRKFAEDLNKATGLNVILQDEALTSHRAEDLLKLQGKKYTKDEIDSISAYLILMDYLESK